MGMTASYGVVGGVGYAQLGHCEIEVTALVVVAAQIGLCQKL